MPRFYKRDKIGQFARIHSLRAGRGAKKIQTTAQKASSTATNANAATQNRLSEARGLVSDVRRLNRELRGVDTVGGSRPRTFKRRPGTVEARAQLTGPVVISSSRTTRSRLSGKEVTKTRSVTLNPGDRVPNSVVLSRQPRKRRERRTRARAL